MASEPHKNQEPKEQQQQQQQQQQEHAANADATHREACEYWGYLLKPDKCGTARLDCLLKGIAETIVSGGDGEAHVMWESPSADDATVEQQVRARRVARPHAFADCSVVS
jgi:hypothetical protein